MSRHEKTSSKTPLKMLLKMKIQSTKGKVLKVEQIDIMCMNSVKHIHC